MYVHTCLWQAAIGRLRATLEAAAVHEADDELLQSTMEVLKLYLCLIMCTPGIARHLAMHSMVDGVSVDQRPRPDPESYMAIVVASLQQ